MAGGFTPCLFYLSAFPPISDSGLFSRLLELVLHIGILISVSVSPFPSSSPFWSSYSPVVSLSSSLIRDILLIDFCIELQWLMPQILVLGRQKLQYPQLKDSLCSIAKRCLQKNVLFADLCKESAFIIIASLSWCAVCSFTDFCSNYCFFFPTKFIFHFFLQFSQMTALFIEFSF